MGNPPNELPVLPLRNLVLFPGIVLPVDVGRAGSLKLVEDVVGRGAMARLVVATQRDPQIEDPGPDDLHPIGVEAEMLKVVKLSDTRVTVVLRGIGRMKIQEFTRRYPYLVAKVERYADLAIDPVEIEGLSLAVREAAKQMIELSPEIPDEAGVVLEQIREPGKLADLAAANLDLSVEERLGLLSEPNVKRRLETVLASLRHRIEVFRVKERIDTQVREEFSRHQREMVLRQKMKAIQDELGELGDETADIAELEKAITDANMPEEVLKVAKKQLGRLAAMPAASAEYTVTRTYLEWLIEVPWSKETADKLDLDAARAILDADHYDLDKVKRRIVEYLAVRKLAPNKRGPILCFVGPPGVGKTSLGRSIARSLGREFVRVSLGGVRDEAEIRGHRRTYIGALPGRIIQGLKRAGTRNPVFMLDELDKVGADFRGDPSAALLEVLDPEQNFSFSDHYLEVPFDLSHVMWIATANLLDPVPAALRDRLEILELPGYTHEEKRQIARRHLLPKQLDEHGLTEHHLTITDAALDLIIGSYTREAGVRNLEREIAAVCRGVAVKVAAGQEYKTELAPAEIPGYLGPEKFISEIAERTEEPGVATGLAWTPTGGDILFIEATRMIGKGNLVLTGQLGNVMKESAQAAMAWVRSHASELGIDPAFYEKTDMHIHVPAGAIPKDGPSAGTAILGAIVSLLTGRRVLHDVAMTGEITLRGNVLPVGGIKEKVLAAHRAGVRRVLLPERNLKDLGDIPEEVRTELEITPIKHLDEVIHFALEEPCEETRHRALVEAEAAHTPPAVPPPSPASA
jgi:ATP-dependent Lon protease